MKSNTTNDISLYLDNMKKLLSTLDTRLVIKNTDKNYKFKYLYKIDRKYIVETLNDLEITDFDRTLISTNKNHLGEMLYVWNPIRVLTDASGKEREIQLYIKTYLNEGKELVVIISFHEYKDYGGD